MPELEPVVRLRGIRVVFPARAALDDVDLDVSPAAVSVITGANGAGKSTLLEVIAGTRQPTAGRRTITGSIAFVPQRLTVSDRLPVTARDVATVGAWGRVGLWRRLPRELDAAIDEVFDRLGLTEHQRQPFTQLSGGQQQRTLLAQGLVRDADLLLMDEPTTGLDAASAEQIRAEMRAEADRGVAVVCVSHDSEVKAIADHLVHLDSGRIAESPDGSRRRGEIHPEMPNARPVPQPEG